MPTTLAAPAVPVRHGRLRDLTLYFLLGVLFGIVLTKSEAVSWFRIQEMFRFQSFHMYGILSSAVVVAGVAIALLKRYHVKTLRGEDVVIAPKTMGRGIRYWAGGSLFGIGWAFTGACPGPLFALLGSGLTVIVVPVLAALAGTYTYGWLRPRLPH
jgi:uncharacterized membrane protein YedE/YeeE